MLLPLSQPTHSLHREPQLTSVLLQYAIAISHSPARPSTVKIPSWRATSPAHPTRTRFLSLSPFNRDVPTRTSVLVVNTEHIEEAVPRHNVFLRWFSLLVNTFHEVRHDRYAMEGMLRDLEQKILCIRNHFVGDIYYLSL